MSKLRQKGQGLVEFALILPLLLLMLYGIVEFGRMFQAYMTVQHAAREAARYAITGQPPGATMDERVRAIKQRAVEATAGINVGNIDWRECGCGAAPGCLYPTCPMNAQHWYYENQAGALLVQVYTQEPGVGLVENDAGGPGERVFVRVIYNYQPLTPFFASGFPRIRLSGQMEMINEGFGLSGASHGGVLPPTLEPLPEMGEYASDTEFTDSTGYTNALGDADKHQYILGTDLIFVTVTDKDENFYLDQADTVTVIVRDQTTGDSETLTLTEIAANAGVFRNTTGLTSAVASGPVTSNNGVLETRHGYTIIATYTDNDNPGDVSSDPARMTGAGASTTRFTDNGGVDVVQYTIGGSGVYVTVDDSDEVGTVTVTVTVASGDVETLTLTETGGVFRNTLGLATTGDPVSPGDNILQVRHCDTITAVYRDDDDPGDTSSDTATMMYTDSAGSVAFDRDEYYINVNLIFVEVRDDDENENCLAPDQVTVTVGNVSTADSETLTLNETGANTGIFRNIIGLPSGPNPGGILGNGLLEAQEGNEIRATYRDNDNAGDTSTDTAIMRTQITSSATSFTDSEGTDVSVYSIGVDGIYVTVTDGDENTNSSTAQQVIVTVTDETGDRETLTLTETGFNTGVFRNIMPLQSITGTVSVGDGVLQTRSGNTATAGYADNDDPGDTSSDTALMGMLSTTRFTGNGGADVIQYAIGAEGIYVTVTDSDENINSGVAEEVTVTITDSVTGDSETLTLTETGADTGVFRNTTGLASSSGPGSSGNGTLNTAGGSTITATYVDKDGAADTSSDTATMIIRTPSATLFVNNLGVEQDEYYLGTQLIYVTVTDGDENLNPNVIETVFITVTDSQTVDSERLTLYETGVNTGIFRGGGLASTQALPGVPGNNLLETQPGNTITATYTDDDDGTDTSSDTALMRASDQPPDLVVTSITVGGSNLALGDQTTITVTVRNQNMGSVTSTLFDVDFYIYTSPDTPPVSGRPGIAKQWYTENVPGGTEIQLTYPITLTQAGTLYLYAQADTTGRVAEADETNNIYLLQAPYVTINVGCDVRFSDNMESGVGGWTTQVGEGAAVFTRVAHTSDSGGVYYQSPTYAWWVDDPAGGLQSDLISPVINVPSGLASMTLRFWHRMTAEVVSGTPYDGGWLRYNLDGGGWSDVTAAMITSGGYNGQLPDNIATPRHEAWTGTIFWQEVVANIPVADTTRAHTVQFRWHFEGDRSSGAPSTPPRRGWWIDDVTASGCEGPSPPPPPGSQVCVRAFQDSFGGTLSQWSLSNASYVSISTSASPPPSSVPGRLRLRTQQGPSSEEFARTAQNINLSGYGSATLSYSWWTDALDSGEWGQVRVSNNGGSTWTTIATYIGTNSGSASIPLSGAYLTNQFRIEFRVRSDRWQSGNYERFEVDNVALEACNTVPIPPPVPGRGNISGITRYYDPATGESYLVSGVDVWATCTDCVPPEDVVYTYSLGDYTYGFYNLTAGTYSVYAEAIINNNLYNRTYTVIVNANQTTTRNIYLTRAY